MDNNKESHIVGKPKKIKDDSLIEAFESDYELNKSISKRLKIKSLINFLKEIFGLILFIIYGLGAFVQVLELSRIDLSYLRFFSATQLASDGALVFVTLAIFLVVGYAYYFIVNLKFRDKNKLFKKEEKISIVNPILIISTIILATYFLFIKDISIEEYKSTSFIFLIFSSIWTALLAHFIKYTSHTFYQIEYLKEKNSDIKNIKILKLLLTTISILSYILIPMVFIKTLTIYSSLLREPKDFENYNKVGLLIKEQHKDISKFKILYFNDKYTFIELNRATSNKDTIEVYKTDAILFDETVIKIKK